MLFEENVCNSGNSYPSSNSHLILTRFQQNKFKETHISRSHRASRHPVSDSFFFMTFNNNQLVGIIACIYFVSAVIYVDIIYIYPLGKYFVLLLPFIFILLLVTYMYTIIFVHIASFVLYREHKKSTRLHTTGASSVSESHGSLTASVDILSNHK